MSLDADFAVQDFGVSLKRSISAPPMTCSSGFFAVYVRMSKVVEAVGRVLKRYLMRSDECQSMHLSVAEVFSVEALVRVRVGRPLGSTDCTDTQQSLDAGLQTGRLSLHDDSKHIQTPNSDIIASTRS